MDFTPEQTQVVMQKGKDNGVTDPRILFAIMIAEGGKPGMEFNYGIEHTPDGVAVPEKFAGLERQAGNAAFTVRKAERLYGEETGNHPTDGGLYTPEFIKYLSHGGTSEATKWPGYAPLQDSRDTEGKNFNHAKNVLLAYVNFTDEKPWPPESQAPVTKEPNTPAVNMQDEYGKSRVREMTYGEIGVMAGAEAASDVGDLHNKMLNLDRAEGKGETTSPWDYVTKPVSAVLDAVHYATGHTRSAMFGHGWKETDIQEITGLQNEPITPEIRDKLKKGIFGMSFPVFMSEMPKRFTNMALDFATDPLNMAGAGLGMASKMSKLLKSAEVNKTFEVAKGGVPELSVETGTGIPPASSASPNVLPQAKAGGTTALAPSTSVAPSVPSVAPKGSATLEPGVIGRTGFEGETVIDSSLPVHPMKTPVPERVKAALKKDVMTPEETQMVSEYNASQKAKASSFEATQKMQQTEAKAAGVAQRDAKGRFMKAELLAESATANVKAAPIKPPSVDIGGPTGAQQVLTGFGLRAPKDAITPASTPKQVAATQKVPEPKQLEMAYQGMIDHDSVLKDLRATLKSSSMTDEQVTAMTAKLLSTNKANVYTVLHGGMPDLNPSIKVSIESSIHKSIATQFDETVKAYTKNPTDELKERMLSQLVHTADVSKAIWSSDLERAAAQRMTKKGQSPVVQAFEALAKNLPEGRSADRLAYVFKTLEGEKAKTDFIRNVAGVGPVKGTLLQIMMNGLISGTATPLWNFAAGTSLFGAKVMETWRMSRFADSGVKPGTAGVLAWSFVKSYADIMMAGSKLNKNLTPAQKDAVGRLSKEMEAPKGIFGTKEAAEDAGQKLGSRRAISAENYGVEDSWFSPAIDYAGHAINVPTFMVGSSDAFLRFATSNAFMEARAFNEASMDVFAQLQAGKQMTKAQAAQAVEARRAALKADPSQSVMFEGKLKPLKEIGSDNSDLLSMMSQLKSGTLAAKFDDATRNSLLGRALYPFFRVGYLSGREAIIRTPILARLAPSVRADLAAGGERAAKAHAQMSTGYALGAMATVFSASGIMNGDGPPDPKMNAIWRTKHTPNSIQIPGTETTIPFVRLGPLGQYMKFVANAAYMLPRVADSENIAGDLATTLAATFASLAIDQNFNRDISELFSAMAGRDKTGLTRWADSKSTMLLPYSALLKQLNKQIQGELQLSDGIMQRASMLIPGYKGVTYYDVWGKVAEVPNDTAWDGFRNNTGFGYRNNDPRINKLVDTLDSDRVTFTGPARNRDGALLKLDEYMELRRLFGSDMHGHNLVTDLETLIESPKYKMASPGPRGSRQTLVSSVVQGYHEAAFSELMKQKNNDGTHKHQAFIDDWMDKKRQKVSQDPGKLLEIGK